MLCFLPKKDPRRLHSCNKECVCSVHLGINHPLPHDKSSVALDCYANLELVSAFAGQKLLIGLRTTRPPTKQSGENAGVLRGTGFRSWGQGTSEEETGATASECHERLDDGLRQRKDSFHSNSRLKEKPQGES